MRIPQVNRLIGTVPGDCIIITYNVPKMLLHTCSEQAKCISQFNYFCCCCFKLITEMLFGLNQQVSQILSSWFYSCPSNITTNPRGVSESFCSRLECILCEN